MTAKGKDEPLHKIIGSDGRKNQAIKDYFRKLLHRRKPPHLQA
jgi:hypothetical protein